MDVKDFYYGRPDQSENDFGVAYADLRHLEEQDLIAQASGMGGMESLAAMVTARGHDFLEQLAAQRADKVQRRIACRDAMVAWLYSCDALNTSSQPVREWMLRNPKYGTWLAQPFQAADLADATGWLSDQGLARGLTAAQDPGLLRLCLTSEGVSCAERFDANTIKYLERNMERSSGPSVNISHNSGPVQVAGDHAHQVQNIGVDADRLRDLIIGLAEVVRSAVSDASDLDVQRETALVAAGDRAVDRSVIERFGTWVLSIVSKGAAAPLASVITTAVNEMIHEASKVAAQLT